LSGATTSWEHRPNLVLAFRPLRHNLGPPAYFLNFKFGVLLSLPGNIVRQKCYVHKLSSGTSTALEHRPNLESAFRPLGQDLGPPANFFKKNFVVLLSLKSVIYAKNVIFTDFCSVPALLQNIGLIWSQPFGHFGHDLGPPANFLNFYFGVLLSLHGNK
jgi:hypothetical protein